jgi:nucleoid-associated protein YgaU
MSRLALIGAAGAVVLILAAGLIYTIGQQEDDDAQDAPAVTETTPESGSDTAPASDPGNGGQAAEPAAAEPQATQAEADEVQTGSVANPAAAPEAAPSQILPSFDVVRVNPNGDAVIAGRAEPGALVVLLDDGKIIGQTETDDRGEWVLLPDSAIEPGQHKFTLRAQRDGGPELHSERMVIVVVPAPAKDIAGNAVTEPAGALALSVPQSGDGPSQILNLPSTGDEPSSGPVAAPTLDVLDFDSSGRMALSGRAPAQGKVALYLNDRLLGSADVDDDGRWAFVPAETLPVGKHELRIDQLDASGKVVNRVAQPIEQPNFSDLAPEGDKLIVQPGNSLWRLARSTYGDGTRYSVIYEANKDRIRDPDLIYPGQVFDLPQ